MLVFDVETLSKSSEAVILSMACVYFNPGEKLDYNKLLKDAFFAKLDVQRQVKEHHRKIDKGTIDWWGKQCQLAKEKSFIPTPIDDTFENAYQNFRYWVKDHKAEKDWIFSRGMLDQLVLDSYEGQLGIEPIFHYNRWRDVRTAIDIIYETETGYVDVENFDAKAHVIKHDPVHDCAYDAMMIVHGIHKNRGE